MIAGPTQFKNGFICVALLYVCSLFFLDFGISKYLTYLLLLALLLHAWTDRHKVLATLKNPSILLFLIFLGYNLLSSAWSAETTLEGTAKFFKCAFRVSVFVIAVSLLFAEVSRRTVLLRWLSLSGLATAAYLFVRYVLTYGNDFSERFGFQSVFEWPTATGSAFGMVLLVLVFYFLVDRQLPVASRVAAAAASVFLGGVVLMTQSRGPLLAVLICLVGGFILGARHVARYLTGILAAVSGVLVLLYTLDYDLISLYARKDAMRLRIWSAAWDSICQAPLFGHGLLTEPEVSFLVKHGKKLITVLHPHNLYLETLMVGGVVGLVLLLALLGRAFQLACRHRQSRYGLTVLVLLVLTVTVHLFDNLRLISNPGVEWLLFWLPVGMAMALEGESVDLGHHSGL